MAEDKKLDSLLERIYQDAIEKSSKKNDELLHNAKEEAKKILAQATKEAAAIISDAERKSEEIKRNTLTDVRMSGDQAISALKQKIKDIVVAKTLKDNLKEAFADDKFLKALILEIVKSMENVSPESDITIYFPENKKKEIDTAFKNSIKKSIKNAVVEFDKSLSKGFKIVPSDGNYQLQFSDYDFVEFFSYFLKQKTEEILFKK